MRRSAVLVPLLLLAGCGSSGGSATLRSFTTHSYGHGASRVWVLRPEGKPRALVVFVHGYGDVRETTPQYHRPWLEHLASRGVEVVYPRYEVFPGQDGGLGHLMAGLAVARRHVELRGVPVVDIGYSRGGRLVADAASLGVRAGFPPRAVLSVFPSGAMDPLRNLAGIPHSTRFVMLAGDHDEVVGHVGIGQLATQLAASGFPYASLRLETIRSHGSFVASHLSVLDRTPAARAAYWARADRLIDSVSRGN